jgi:hypothetical protein
MYGGTYTSPAVAEIVVNANITNSFFFTFPLPLNRQDSAPLRLNYQKAITP